MRLFLLFILSIPLAGLAQNQDVAKATRDVTPGPTEITIPAESVVKIQTAAKDARIKQLEVENYLLRAQTELKRLQDEAKHSQDAADAVYRESLLKAGVPIGDVGEYQATAAPNEKGEIVLKRKTKAPPSSN